MEQEIIKAINTIFTGVDERDWRKVESAMADRILIDYTSMNGGEPLTQTPAEVTGAWAAFLPGFDRTKHTTSDFDVKINDQVASVHYYGRGDHYIGEEVWTAEGTFDTGLKLINGRWLVTDHKFNFGSQSGNVQLPARAGEIVKKKSLSH